MAYRHIQINPTTAMKLVPGGGDMNVLLVQKDDLTDETKQIVLLGKDVDAILSHWRNR